jgi:C1A family cysteine protease
MPAETLKHLKTLRQGIADSLQKDPRFLTLNTLDRSIAEISKVLVAAGLIPAEEAAGSPAPLFSSPNSAAAPDSPKKQAAAKPLAAAALEAGSEDEAGAPKAEADSDDDDAESDDDAEDEPSGAVAAGASGASDDADDAEGAESDDEDGKDGEDAAAEKDDEESDDADDAEGVKTKSDDADGKDAKDADDEDEEESEKADGARGAKAASAAPGAAEDKDDDEADEAADAAPEIIPAGKASGYVAMAARPGAAQYQPSATIKFTKLPNKVDLRPLMTAVEDQGQTSSCVANAVVGAYEYWIKKAARVDENISRLFVYYNARWRGGSQDKDDGSVIQLAMEGLAKFGACSEKVWPFDKKLIVQKPGAEAYKDAAPRRVQDMAQVPLTVEAWKQALAEGKPIVFGCLLFDSFDQCQKRGGVVPMPDPKDLARSKHSGHSMCAVGYSDTEKVFIVRNSWGAEWGDKGYCYMPYAYLMNPKFNDGDCWVFVPKVQMPPPRDVWSDTTTPVTNDGKGVDFVIESYSITDYANIAIDLFANVRRPYNETILPGYRDYVSWASIGQWSMLTQFDVSSFLSQTSVTTEIAQSSVSTTKLLDTSETNAATEDDDESEADSEDETDADDDEADKSDADEDASKDDDAKAGDDESDAEADSEDETDADDDEADKSDADEDASKDDDAKSGDDESDAGADSEDETDQAEGDEANGDDDAEADDAEADEAGDGESAAEDTAGDDDAEDEASADAASGDSDADDEDGDADSADDASDDEGGDDASESDGDDDGEEDGSDDEGGDADDEADDDAGGDDDGDDGGGDGGGDDED